MNDPVATLVERMRGRLEPLLDETVAALRKEVPGYGPDDGLADDDVRETLRIYLLDALDQLGGETGADVLDAPMRRRVEQGMALTDMLQSYRLGIARLWQALAALASDDRTATDALVAATPIVFALLDRYSMRAGAISHEVALRQARRDGQVRAALLDAVLTREPSIGAAFWEAVARLGIPHDGRFLAVTVNGTGEDDLEDRFAGLPGVEGAWFRVGPRSQAGLLCLGPGGAHAQLWTPILEQVTLVAGVSAAYTTVSGSPKAYAQSHVAATAATARRRLVFYDQDLLPVLLASAPTAAGLLVSETLGPVLDQPEDRRDAIIETVGAWLECGQSVNAVAERMHCHRNTVNYRLKRFQELTGRSLTDNAWLAQVVLALEALRLG